MEMLEVSIVVPIYNEEENVALLHNEIKQVCEKNKYIYEIIFVDDGSKDKTYDKCKELKPLKFIKLRRNFGQTAAMDAGIKEAKYGIIVTMDGDRQNDPNDIPNLIDYLENNQLDVVSGWRKNRKDTFAKKFTSRGANLLRKIILKDTIHDSGCSLKVYRKECFEHVNLYGEMHRFIPALLQIKGFEIGEVIVNHRPRVAGKTKYNWKRTFKGFVDMISLWFWNRYAVRPLHILGPIGMISLFMGGVCGIWSVVLFLLGYKMSNNIIPPLLTVFFIVVGLFLFIFGLMSDVLIKIYYGVNIDKAYNIKSIEVNQSDEEKK